MLSIRKKKNEINLLDSDEVLLSFPTSVEEEYKTAPGQKQTMHLLAIGDYHIHVHFDDNDLKIMTTKNHRLDGLQLSYNTQTKEGLLEVYQDGEHRCDEKIDGYRNKFMLNIFFDPSKTINNTVTFESWHRPSYNANISQKDGPQATHDLNRERLSFHLLERGERSYINNIYPDKYCEFSIVTTGMMTIHSIDTTHKNGKKEESTLTFLSDGPFLGGNKKIYQKGRLISSGGLTQDESNHGPVYMYDEKGKKTEYEYYHGRRVANWTRRKTVAKWIGGLAIAGAFVYATASADTPEKIDTQKPVAAKQLGAKDNQHI